MRKNAKTNLANIQPSWSITNVRWGGTWFEAASNVCVWAYKVTDYLIPFYFLILSTSFYFLYWRLRRYHVRDENWGICKLQLSSTLRWRCRVHLAHHCGFWLRNNTVLWLLQSVSIQWLFWWLCGSPWWPVRYEWTTWKVLWSRYTWTNNIRFLAYARSPSHYAFDIQIQWKDKVSWI